MKLKTTRKRVLHTLSHLEKLDSRTDWEKSLITYLTMIRTNGSLRYMIIDLSIQEATIWARYNR